MSNFHKNDDSVAKQISFLIYKRLPDKKSKMKEHKTLLIECMDSKGYIYYNPQTESDSESEPGFEQETYLPEFTYLPGEEQFVQSIAEKSQSSVSRYNRTFIDESHPGNKRLYAVQKYAITPEEQEYNQINEQIDSVLNKVSIKFPELPFQKIKEESMEFYLKIKKVYRESNLLRGEIKGSIKLGYILLSVYYTLIKYKICVTKEELVVYFENTSLSDLPKADKNIKMIFGENENVHEICLCGMRSLFNKEQIDKLEKGIRSLKENNKFNSPALKVQVAAAIHHFTKTSITIISGYCGISPEIIRKTVNQTF
jgi:hypothetical protein